MFKRMGGGGGGGQGCFKQCSNRLQDWYFIEASFNVGVGNFGVSGVVLGSAVGLRWVGFSSWSRWSRESWMSM